MIIEAVRKIKEVMRLFVEAVRVPLKVVRVLVKAVRVGNFVNFASILQSFE